MQRYKCIHCGTCFQNKRRKRKKTKQLFHDYVWKRQTYKDLGEDNRKIIQTALDLLNAHQLSEDELEKVNEGWLSIEKHQQFVQRQEEEATRILENSSSLN